ncbi:hypothetical protein DFJ74DRAFT_693455 [Hyaloraphidium curvatum]|nr:hypothetical protein DFJ74DRAFT_693455 [Hyaloraphidium curvatum]
MFNAGGTSAMGGSAFPGFAGQPVGGPPLSFLDRATQTQWEALFSSASGGGAQGIMSGDAVRSVLLRSGLAQDRLAQIWQLSHLQPPAVPGLSLPEFLLAMFLAKRSADSGMPPPQQLPDAAVKEVMAAMRAVGLPIGPSAAVPSAPAAPQRGASPVAGTGWAPSAASRPASRPASPAVAPSAALPVASLSFSIPLAQQAQFDTVFAAWDRERTGFLPGNLAREVLGQSGLPLPVLGRIWEMVDVDNRGKLNKKEFAAAMFLVNRTVQGLDLPASLPKELFAFIRGVSLTTTAPTPPRPSGVAPTSEPRSVAERLAAIRSTSPPAADPPRGQSPAASAPTEDFESRFPDLDDLVSGKLPSKPVSAMGSVSSLAPQSAPAPALPAPTSTSSSKSLADLDALLPSLIALERRKAEARARIASERRLLSSLRSQVSERRIALERGLEKLEAELASARKELESGGEEDVQARAARMLAERMARMGITGLAPAPAADDKGEKDREKKEALEKKVAELERARGDLRAVLDELSGVAGRREVPEAALDKGPERPSPASNEARSFLARWETQVESARGDGKREGEKAGREREAEKVKAPEPLPARDQPAPPPPISKKPPPPPPAKPVLDAKKGPPPPPPVKKPKTPEPSSPQKPAEQASANDVASKFPDLDQIMGMDAATLTTITEVVEPEPSPTRSEVAAEDYSAPKAWDGTATLAKEQSAMAPEASSPGSAGRLSPANAATDTTETLVSTPPPSETAFNPFGTDSNPFSGPSLTQAGAAAADEFWKDFGSEAPAFPANPFDTGRTSPTRPRSMSPRRSPSPPKIRTTPSALGIEVSIPEEPKPAAEPEATPAPSRADELAELRASSSVREAREAAKRRESLTPAHEAPKSTADDDQQGAPRDGEEHGKDRPVSVAESLQSLASDKEDWGPSGLLSPGSFSPQRRVSDDWLMAPVHEQLKPQAGPGSPVSDGPTKAASTEKDLDALRNLGTSRLADRKKMLEGLFVGGGAGAPAAKPKEGAVSDTPKATTQPKAKKWPTVEVEKEDSAAPAAPSLAAAVKSSPENVFSDSKEDVFADAATPEPAAALAKEVPAAPEQTQIGTFIRHVYALYPFPKNQPDDLNFAEGAKIGVEREEGDWLYGRVVEGEGERDDPGWFPASYVSDSPAEPVDGLPASGASVPEAPALPDKPVCLAEVLYDYEGARDDELPIKEGWIVNIMSKADEGWWVAEKDGKRGVVPATYVQELSEEAAAAKLQKASRKPAAHRHGRSMSIADDGHSAARKHAHRSSDPATGAATGRMPLSRSHTDLNLAFGERRTWASQVDPAFLEQTLPEERKRQEAIFELISTEQTYVRDLQLILEVFYQPLQQLPGLTSQDLVGIFNNIEDILICNSLILSDFEKLQADQGGVVHAIGAAFLKHVKPLQAYQQYCGKQMQTSKFLQKKRTEDKNLGDFLKRAQLHPKCRSLDLSSFLLEPFQRITRYPLIFRQILHYTPKDHPDHQQVMESLDACESLLDKVNEMVRDIDNRAKLEEITQQVDLDSSDENINLFSATKYVGPRMFVYEGPLAKAKSGRKLHALLFNDLLLITQARSQAAKTIGGKPFLYTLYRKAIPLNECVAREIPPTSKPPFPVDDSCFQVIHLQDVITFRASSVPNKRTWLNHLDSQCSAIAAAIKKAEKSKAAAAAGATRSPTNAMGTLELTVVEAKDLVQPENSSKCDIFVAAQIDQQKFKTRSIRDNLSPKWNQPLLFTIHSLDDYVRLTVYNYDKYSSDEFLGTCQISLDMLEYYGNKETDKIPLPLKGVPSGTLIVTLQYRKS